MSNPVLEFWFDFSCPFAYLASTQVEALAARLGVELVPKPMLLGGVFKAREVPSNLQASLGAEKARHNLDDMRRFAALYGVTLTMPAGHPIRTVLALRALLAAGVSFPLIHRFYAAYWVEGIDLATPDGVSKVLAGAGLDAQAILLKAESAAVKDELRARTEEAIALGIFGAPTFIVRRGDQTQLFFGQDRMGDVERALGGTPKPLAEPPPADASLFPVDFFFDYASSYSFIASPRVEALLGSALRYRPMLLGGVFKQVNPADPSPPLLSMNEAKRAFTFADILRQAQQAGLPIQFPSRFPMPTMLPLRVTLLALDQDEAKARVLIRSVFRAYWVEDRDISAPDLIGRLASEAGLDGAKLVADAETPAAKAALKHTTGLALGHGAFGAPSFVVHAKGHPPALFFGNDRLELAALASQGDRRLL